MTLIINRRAAVTAMTSAAIASACQTTPTAPTYAALTVNRFHARRRYADTPSGSIAYVSQGRGPAAIFLHGVPLNGFHWRHVMAGLANTRQCIALDLMGLGYTRISSRQDVSFNAQARMLRQFVDALHIQQFDLIANDSGGGIAQIFAANHPKRLRSLTLTNCDTHDNWPPPSIAPTIAAAAKGNLIDRYVALVADSEARYQRFSRSFSEPLVLTDEVYKVYIDPLHATQERRDAFHRYWLAMNSSQTVAIEPQLRTLKVPTMIVWALADEYFDVRWARWLQRTIPGAETVIELPEAKLFFPEDQPQRLIEPLRAFLTQHPPRFR